MEKRMIKYDELFNEVNEENNSRIKSTIITLCVCEIIIFALMKFALEMEFIYALLISLTILPLFIILIVYLILRSRSILKIIEKHRDEINEYCFSSRFIDYVYTKHCIIDINANNIRGRELYFKDIISASNVVFADDYGDNYKTKIKLNNGKKVYLHTSDLLCSVLLKYYSNDEQEKIKKRIIDSGLLDNIDEGKEDSAMIKDENGNKIFNHKKYGAIKYSETHDNNYDNVQIFYDFKDLKGADISITINVSTMAFKEFLKSDGIKQMFLDKYFEYEKKNLLNCKRRFVDSNIDDLFNWYEDSNSNTESSPLYTKNKSKSEFKEALMKNYDLKLSTISLDNDYNIINVELLMDFGGYSFIVYYDIKTDEMETDIVS